MQKSKRMSLLKTYIKEHKDVKIKELSEQIDVSESTIRRDIKDLVKEGFVREYYGSVVLLEKNQTDTWIDERLNSKVEEKSYIGQLAAEQIDDDDFVFIDAGTTTFHMIKSIKAKNITVVTNGINVASELVKYGIDTRMLAGKLKATTMAIVGEEAILQLMQYHFDVCFIGANGLNKDGYNTPDLKEGLVKKTVIHQSSKTYILADSSKESVGSAFTFAKLEEGKWINELSKEVME